MCVSRKVCKISNSCDQFHQKHPSSKEEILTHFFLRFPLSLKGTKKWTRTFQGAVTTTKTHPQPQREATVRSMIDAWSVFTRCYRKPRGPTTWERTSRVFFCLCKKWWGFQWERTVGMDFRGFFCVEKTHLKIFECTS